MVMTKPLHQSYRVELHHDLLQHIAVTADGQGGIVKLGIAQQDVRPCQVAHWDRLLAYKVMRIGQETYMGIM